MNTTEPDPTTKVTLEPDYDDALIGTTAAPGYASRAVYSLNTLARIRSRQGNHSIESAQEDVIEMVNDIVRTHGNRAPVFVDDSPPPAPKKGESRLILPGMARFNVENS